MIEETSVPGIEDSVRVYLRQMGKVPLLTPQREVELARRIEVGREQVILSVLGTEAGRSALRELGAKVGRNEIAVDAVVDLMNPEIGDAERRALAKQVGRGRHDSPEMAGRWRQPSPAGPARPRPHPREARERGAPAAGAGAVAPAYPAYPLRGVRQRG